MPFVFLNSLTFLWMKCANSLNSRFKFVRGIWALQKVKELHKHLVCFVCPSVVSILCRKVLTGFFYEIGVGD